MEDIKAFIKDAILFQGDTDDKAVGILFHICITLPIFAAFFFTVVPYILNK